MDPSMMDVFIKCFSKEKDFICVPSSLAVCQVCSLVFLLVLPFCQKQ
jgi:hypothetical protein